MPGLRVGLLHSLSHHPSPSALHSFLLRCFWNITDKETGQQRIGELVQCQRIGLGYPGDLVLSDQREGGNTHHNCDNGKERVLGARGRHRSKLSCTVRAAEVFSRDQLRVAGSEAFRPGPGGPKSLTVTFFQVPGARLWVRQGLLTCQHGFLEDTNILILNSIHDFSYYCVSLISSDIYLETSLPHIWPWIWREAFWPLKQTVGNNSWYGSQMVIINSRYHLAASHFKSFLLLSRY